MPAGTGEPQGGDGSIRSGAGRRIAATGIAAGRVAVAVEDGRGHPDGGHVLFRHTKRGDLGKRAAGRGCSSSGRHIAPVVGQCIGIHRRSLAFQRIENPSQQRPPRTRGADRRSARGGGQAGRARRDLAPCQRWRSSGTTDDGPRSLGVLRTAGQSPRHLAIEMVVGRPCVSLSASEGVSANRRQVGRPARSARTASGSHSPRYGVSSFIRRHRRRSARPRQAHLQHLEEDEPQIHRLLASVRRASGARSGGPHRRLLSRSGGGAYLLAKHS